MLKRLVKAVGKVIFAEKKEIERFEVVPRRKSWEESSREWQKRHEIGMALKRQEVLGYSSKEVDYVV